MEDEHVNPFLSYLSTVFSIVHEMWRGQDRGGYVTVDVRLVSTAAARVSICFSVNAFDNSTQPRFPDVLAKVNLWARMSVTGIQPCMEGYEGWDAQGVSAIIVARLQAELERRNQEK